MRFLVLYHHPEYWRVQQLALARNTSELKSVRLEIELKGCKEDAIGDLSDPGSMFELGLATDSTDIRDKIKEVLKSN